MKKASVLRYAAIGMASMSLAGFAAASTVTVGGTTGPDSVQKVHLNNTKTFTSTNTNAVGLGNTNFQGAASGNVSAYKNTQVGPAGSGSGAANNVNATQTNVAINNGSNAAALAALAGLGGNGDVVSLSGVTGPDSYTSIHSNNETDVSLSNTNVVSVQNTNVQGAQSGNVHASKNTQVGGLTSGAASNTNTTSTSVQIGN
jgi:hypothetical protein